MATYYVRNDGSNSNTGLGSTASQAWQTITYALANMVLTAGNNYLYVAPGTYRESPVVTITPTSTNRLVISGDPMANNFPNVTANQVRVTGATADTTASASGTRFDLGTKTYITLENFCIDHNGAGGTYAINIQGSNVTVRKNVIHSYYLGGGVGGGIRILPAAASDNNILIDGNILWGVAFGIYVGLIPNLVPVTSASSGVVIQNCRIHGNGWQNSFPITVTPQYSTIIAQVIISNCIILQSNNTAISFSWSSSVAHIVQNCIIAMSSGGIVANNGASVTQRNNLLFCGGNLSNVASDVSTITSDYMGFDLGQSLLYGLSGVPFGTILGSRNANFGTSLSAPTTDSLGYAWTGPNPDLGTSTYRSLSSLGTFVPSERNVNSIMLTANSVSQSVELYLGVTGLTATSTGLAAYYSKNRTADVAIPLVARTISQGWVAGGFAEVNPTTMPGVYRLDIPNEAISSGYSNTTIIVRGATGTSSAVMTIQEPQASASQVRMGPFTVQADGVLTDERLKLFKGSIHSIDFKMVDQYGTGVDGTGTVVTANAYNSAGFLVDSYPCTAKYAEDGRYSFAIDATVTNVVGMYTINISRQIGSEINVFGRMKLEVLSP
jgi:hypothetical protein